MGKVYVFFREHGSQLTPRPRFSDLLFCLYGWYLTTLN